MVQKLVHIDTLEYTAEGLKTKEPINLVVGEHNRIVLVRPDRRKALSLGAGSFGVDSCFPTPGVLSVSMIAAAQNTVNALLGLNPTSIFQVYGHADPSGDDQLNKELSDKRAEAVRAFLVADIDAVQSLCRSEDWGLREHQLMLRTLKCDPGPIDGEAGTLTAAATRLFQYEYATGVFHRHRTDDEPSVSLESTGELDESTVEALVEAYVLSTSAGLDESQLHPTHAAVGCSEYNRIAPEANSYNRRVSLVVHQMLPVHHDAAPCVAGDVSVCPVDNQDELATCLWYREHVRDTDVSKIQHRHFDLRWLPLTNGCVLLSALTTLPDDEDVVFEVFRTRPVTSADSLGEDSLDAAISEKLAGVIRGSVAQVVWEPPEGMDVFRPQVEPMEDDLSFEELLAAETRVRIPLFRVSGGGIDVFSGPPGRELLRIPAELPDETEHRTGFTAMDWFGNIYQQSSHATARADSALHPLRDGEPSVWGHRHMDRAPGGKK